MKVALRSRGITLEAARKIGKSGVPGTHVKLMSFTLPSSRGPVSFRTALPCSGGYYLERGGMRLG